MPSNYHKNYTKKSWKQKGLNLDNFEYIYEKYINSTHCELCNNEYEGNQNKQMEHNHETGEFRNIVCRSCNQKKADKKIRKDNTSGYIGIYKEINKKLKQGFNWKFSVYLNGKRKTIKTSTDLEWLIKFADKWKKDNNYIT